jgi:ParB family transcriptional regulator, chromosome partitioning protein
MSTATTDSKRRALGKGLDSLLPRVPAAAAHAPAAEAEGGKPREISVELIDPNPFQTRKAVNEEQLAELAASIVANGVVQPILVRPQTNGRFQLIVGERRWRASIKAGKKTVPSLLRQVSDEQAMEITIVENLQRENLNPMEQARAFERLSREFNMTQEQIAQRTGKDRATITNYLRLLKLPDFVQYLVERGSLSFGHAKALLGLTGRPDLQDVAKKVAHLSLSVRQTEGMVNNILNPEPLVRKEPEEKHLDPNVREVKEALQRAIGLKVTIKDKYGHGKVIIEYSKLEDFDMLMEKLAGYKH